MMLLDCTITGPLAGIEIMITIYGALVGMIGYWDDEGMGIG